MFIKIYLCVYCIISELKAAFSLSFWFHRSLDRVIRIISDMGMQSVQHFCHSYSASSPNKQQLPTLTLQAGELGELGELHQPDRTFGASG